MDNNKLGCKRNDAFQDIEMLTMNAKEARQLILSKILERNQDGEYLSNSWLDPVQAGRVGGGGGSGVPPPVGAFEEAAASSHLLWARGRRRRLRGGCSGSGGGGPPRVGA
jgi:hypothetical protein